MGCQSLEAINSVAQRAALHFSVTFFTSYGALRS
jgi:hypothetical protein